MNNTHRAFRRLLSTFLLAIFFAACSLPSSNTPSTQPAQLTPDLIYTSAVQTVIAQLTSAVITPGAGGISETELPAIITSPTLAPITSTVVQATTTPPPTKTPAPSPKPTKPKATATIQPSPKTPSTDPKLSLGDPTFQDKFSNDKNWALTADNHNDMYVKNGVLVMKAFNPDQWDGWALTWPKTTNFYIEMTATTQDCSGLDRYGLILCSKQDASVGYLFGFSCDGRYSFRKWDGVKYTKYVDWTKNSAILKGSDETNRLGVKADGDHFTLYANGVKLTDFHENSYSSGYFGVFVAAAETANFTADVDEIDYWELP
jgi:hypothetical protein